MAKPKFHRGFPSGRATFDDTAGRRREGSCLVPSPGTSQHQPLIPSFAWMKNVENTRFPVGHWCTTGWWFGTFYFPRNIGNVIIPIDFHIFQRGWNHQPDYFSVWFSAFFILTGGHQQQSSFLRFINQALYVSNMQQMTGAWSYLLMWLKWQETTHSLYTTFKNVRIGEGWFLFYQHCNISKHWVVFHIEVS